MKAAALWRATWWRYTILRESALRKRALTAAVSACFRKDLSLGIVYLHQGARQSGAAFIFYAACDPLRRFRNSDFLLRIADCGLRNGKRGIRNLQLLVAYFKRGGICRKWRGYDGSDESKRDGR